MGLESSTVRSGRPLPYWNSAFGLGSKWGSGSAIRTVRLRLDRKQP